MFNFFQVWLTRLFKKSHVSHSRVRFHRSERTRPRSSPRLTLESLQPRLVPSAVATQVLSSGTLTINEVASFQADTLFMTGAGDYQLVDSAGTFDYVGVKNITFNSSIGNNSITFLNASSPNTSLSGNLSVNGNNASNALAVTFGNNFNVAGMVSIADTGSGSSLAVTVGQDTFGSLNVLGGSGITGHNVSSSVADSIHNGSVTGTLVDLEGTHVNGSANVNLGAGGGYFLTNYVLDLSNPANDSPSVSTGLPNVSIGGDLTVTDLRTRSDDYLELYSSNVGGNLSINVSSIGDVRGPPQR